MGTEHRIKEPAKRDMKSTSSRLVGNVGQMNGGEKTIRFSRNTSSTRRSDIGSRNLVTR
jgi:hypothetical protein